MVGVYSIRGAYLITLVRSYSGIWASIATKTTPRIAVIHLKGTPSTQEFKQSLIDAIKPYRCRTLASKDVELHSFIKSNILELIDV